MEPSFEYFLKEARGNDRKGMENSPFYDENIKQILKIAATSQQPWLVEGYKNKFLSSLKQRQKKTRKEEQSSPQQATLQTENPYRIIYHLSTILSPNPLIQVCLQ